MGEKTSEDRRDFLKTAGLTGAGLLAGLYALGDVSPAGAATDTRDLASAQYNSGELRDFVKMLEHKGELVTLSQQVDPKHEIGGYLWRHEQEGKAVFFKNVKGSSMPVVGGLYQNWGRIGLSLGAPGKFGQPQMYERFLAAMSRPIAPKEDDLAPVKKVVLKGGQIDLSVLPVPTLFLGDAGPYITAGVGICKNPQNGTYNIGVYRMQVVGMNKILVWAFPGSDLHGIYKTYEKMGAEMDFAVAIGVDPALFATAVSKVPSNIDEYSVAGSLKGEAIKVVKGETVDLLIPAGAEIVIEGKIDPRVRTVDGPFADHGGIYKGGPSPVLKAAALLHRKDAMYHVVLAGDSLEHCTASEILACFWGRNILDQLQSRFKNVKDVHLSWHGGTKKWVMISLSGKGSAGEARQIVDEVFNCATGRYSMLPVSSFLRTVIVVDEDVDIYEPKDVIWAVGTRLNDTIVLNEDKTKGYELRIGLDASRPFGANPEKYKRTRTMAIRS